MLGVNVWVALRSDAQSAINTRLNWDVKTQGVYTGPVSDVAYKIFKRMKDRATVQSIFRKYDAGAHTWNLWSLYFFESGQALQKAQEALDYLSTNYSNQFQILGAWYTDGRQVGTQWLDREQETTTGTPTYPLHPQLIEFMPDTDDLGTRPTEVTNVNLLFGQKSRRFI